VVGAEAPRREGAQREHAAEEDHRLAGGADARQEREADGRAQEGDGLDDLADLHGRKGLGFRAGRFRVLGSLIGAKEVNGTMRRGSRLKESRCVGQAVFEVLETGRRDLGADGIE
jgi:hypothetical protein